MLRRALAALAWVVVGAFAFGLSALHHLDTPLGRRAVCAEVARRVDGSIAGELRLTCVELSPRRVRLQEVSLRHRGRELVRVDRVELRPDLDAVLRGVLCATALTVERPLVDLREPQALAAALSSLEPSSDRDEPLVLPRVAVDALTVRGGSVPVPGGWTIRDVEVRASVRLGPSVAVTLHELRVGGEREGETVGHLQLDGEIDLSGASELALTAAIPQGQLSGRVGVVWGAQLEDGPRRWSARLAGDLTPELLARVGLPEAAPLLVAPVRVQVDGEGSLEEVAARARLATAGGDLDLSASYDARGGAARAARHRFVPPRSGAAPRH